mmetsp:Transcript_15858/g.47950  ORF Transcript_15858/g.47950 Transcript_15858/m.47950 type:complete len:80 (+) Transcript_15858:37-276(+)
MRTPVRPPSARAAVLMPLGAEEEALRRANEEYLAAHPEVAATQRFVMSKLLAAKPENPEQWLCEFFLNERLEADVRETL